MTEQTDLLFRDLIMMWLSVVMGSEVECVLRCWGECRGFRQLREGSDDPPPPVSTGASAAFADATPKPASRLIRTIIIANARRRGETTCMKPKPLTNTKRIQMPLACLKFCPSESPSDLQRQPCIGLHEPMAEASCLLDAPTLFTIPPDQQATHTSQVRALGGDDLDGWAKAAARQIMRREGGEER